MAAGFDAGRRRWPRLRQAAALVSAAALGALLFSVHIATTVFRDLPDDRLLAGRVAGQAFTSAYAIALIAAVFVLIVVNLKGRREATPERALAIVFVGAAMLECWWVAPAIVHHGAGWPGTFASLHATGGIVHVALAALALFFAWRLLADEANEAVDT